MNGSSPKNYEIKYEDIVQLFNMDFQKNFKAINYGMLIEVDI